MLTKEYIENLKKESNGGFLKLTEKYKDAKNLSFILENLGYLPNEFDGSFLFELLNHENPKVRLLSAKNIAKPNNVENLGKLWSAFKSETDTGTRREIVSAIGRLRKEQNKPFLFEILLDEDPKVVCQAIRGLLH
jgi:HEAT repeat protein